MAKPTLIVAAREVLAAPVDPLESGTMELVEAISIINYDATRLRDLVKEGGYDHQVAADLLSSMENAAADFVSQLQALRSSLD